MYLNFKTLSVFFFISFNLSGQTLPKGFVFLDKEIPNIKVELNYATINNFTGKIVEGYYSNQSAIGTIALSKALSKIQKKLNSKGLGIKIYDAYRPQRAVNEFISWSKNPKDTINKQKYFPELPKERLFELGYIAANSGHSRGSTVDLTLIRLKGDALDMGGEWDFFGERSHFNFKNLSKTQRNNRRLLRKIMKSENFIPYDNEWWHFTLKDEPFPNKYFDFVLKQ